MKLIRFPGEPAIPAGIPLVHSLVLSELEWLVAKDVVDTASRGGETIGLLVGTGRAGLLSSNSSGGEGLAERALVPWAFPFLRREQSVAASSGAGRLQGIREFDRVLRHCCDHSTAFFAILLVFLGDCWGSQTRSALLSV